MIKKQNDARTKKSGMIPWRRYLLPALTFVAGGFISFILFAVVQNWEHENQRIAFESRSMGLANAFESTIHDYEESLRYVGDFFNNSEEITREEFSGFVLNAIARHPGIQAISWNPLVLDPERAEYEARAQEDGFENFQFTELTGEKELARAAQRDEYVVVYYLEPLETNKDALGYDIASNHIRLRAMNQGFDTGNLAATERITLVQEKGEQFGILLLLPIYTQKFLLKNTEDRRKNRQGFVVEVLRIGEVVEYALKDFPDEGVDVYLYDLSAEEAESFLYFRPSRTPDMTKQLLQKEEIQNGLHWSKDINLGSRQWQMMFSPSSFYSESWQSWTVLSGSLLLTCLLAFYLWRISAYTAEIERRVKKETETNIQLEREISERKKSEQDRAHLITELGQKNNELEQIVYVTSHDLRSPLINIEGYSRIIGKAIEDVMSVLESGDVSADIMNKISAILKEDIINSGKYISSSVLRMDLLINGLLQLSRLGRVELQKEELDMNGIISEITTAMKYQLEQADVKLDVSGLPSCTGDRGQISQLFSNLLENAIKFLDPSRQGIITISGSTEKNQSVYRIEDNGIGIAPEHQEKIFEIFHKLSSDREGEGLGLSIVQKIIDMHRGRIAVESEKGKGSRFFIYLPAA